MTPDRAPVLADPIGEQRSAANHLLNLARAVYRTAMVPTHMRGNVDEVFAVMAYGHELGLSAIGSLQSVYLIEGKPSLSANFMRARILAAGHDLEWRTVTSERVVLYGRRRGDRNGLVVEWTLDDARRAGVVGKDVWRKYPRAMLAARATSELARLLFADLLHGLAYTPEELGATGVLATVDVDEAPPPTADAAEVEDLDDRPAHELAADMLDAEDALDAEWLREARGEPALAEVIEEDADDDDG